MGLKDLPKKGNYVKVHCKTLENFNFLKMVKQ